MQSECRSAKIALNLFSSFLKLHTSEKEFTSYRPEQDQDHFTSSCSKQEHRIIKLLFRQELLLLPFEQELLFKKELFADSKSVVHKRIPKITKMLRNICFCLDRCSCFCLDKNMILPHQEA